MPLSDTSKKVKKEMQEQYGKDKGESVFYATANKKGGPAEEAATWKKKKKEAAVNAFAAVLTTAAGMNKQAQDPNAASVWEAIAPYLPYIGVGGLGGLMLGDEETPWWEKLLAGGLIGGGAGYGINRLIPYLQGLGAPSTTRAEETPAEEQLPQKRHTVSRGAPRGPRSDQAPQQRAPKRSPRAASTTRPEEVATGEALPQKSQTVGHRPPSVEEPSTVTASPEAFARAANRRRPGEQARAEMAQKMKRFEERARRSKGLVGRTIEGFGENVADPIIGTGEAAVEGAKDVGRAGVQAVKDVGSGAESTLGNAGLATIAAANRARDAASRAGTAAADQLRSTGHTMQETARRAPGQLYRYLFGTGETLK